MSSTTTTRTGGSPEHRTSRMERVAGWSQRHHWLALVLWVAVVAGITAASSAIGDDYRNDFALPGTESQQVVQTFEEHAPDQSGDTVQIVVQHDDGLASEPGRVASIFDDVDGLPHVAGVAPPVAEQGSVSADGTIGYGTVTLSGQAGEVPVDDIRTIIDTALDAEGDGLTVALGGDAVRGAQESAGGAAEGAGMLAALVILVFMFGSLVAASLPLITALFAVGSTLGLVVLASHIFTVPDYTAPVMMLVGLGVGIDYALLIFSRYRSELLGGAERERAARTALDTAGRSVLFAGGTVIIALLGLLVLGLGSLQGVALGVTLTVLMTMLAAISLLPSLLHIFGGRIERSVRKHAARARRPHGDRWRRWATLVQRSPWPPLLVAVAALVALMLPALDLRLGFADASNDDPATTSRQAYDLLAEGFGPGFNGPLVVAYEWVGEPADLALQEALASTPGIAGATPAHSTPDGEVSTVLAFPETGPQAAQTSDLVAELRENVLPPIEQQTGATYLVGGPTAAADDFAVAVSDRLPIFVAAVVGLSALLLMLVFRSILVPLKAAVLNLLSIGASMGVVTLVFREGMFGIQPGPIEAFVPVMIFAIVFGLSMDYEVFLVSRMHEEWRRSGDAVRAVREGLATTGGVITAAGAIMIVVFGAFLLSPDRMLQQFGLGLAVAVLLDALVIRCLIVPAVMRLFGSRAWRLPRWLDRRLPHVALEREPA
ncbi:MAG: MMPL family transporter [Propionibacteriales bacterium]|nr:MMPL family transporter [Propionibacteriales bacterium]